MNSMLFNVILAIGVNTTGCSPDEKLFLEPHLSPLAGKVVYEGGSALPLDQKASFAHAVSVNQGIHLAPTMHCVSQKECRVIGLAAHLHEVAQSLIPGGTAVITAPASYGVLFTKGSVSSEEVEQKIESALATLGASEDPQVVREALNGLTEVSRATFVKREGKWQRVKDEKTLFLGETVWRKHPDGCQQEIYHSEEEYLVAIRAAGLFCEEIKRPCFFGQVKWEAYNRSLSAGQAPLGAAYRDNHPFTIYHVVKKVS